MLCLLANLSRRKAGYGLLSVHSDNARAMGIPDPIAALFDLPFDAVQIVQRDFTLFVERTVFRSYMACLRTEEHSSFHKGTRTIERLLLREASTFSHQAIPRGDAFMVLQSGVASASETLHGS